MKELEFSKIRRILKSIFFGFFSTLVIYYLIQLISTFTPSHYDGKGARHIDPDTGKEIWLQFWCKNDPTRWAHNFEGFVDGKCSFVEWLVNPYLVWQLIIFGTPIAIIISITFFIYFSKKSKKSFKK